MLQSGWHKTELETVESSARHPVRGQVWVQYLRPSQADVYAVPRLAWSLARVALSRRSGVASAICDAEAFSEAADITARDLSAFLSCPVGYGHDVVLQLRVRFTGHWALYPFCLML